MKIAIISDIHDSIANLRAALRAMESVDEIICCGDLCSPFIVSELGEGFPRPIHVVFGNNDGDRFRISSTAERYSNIRILGEFAEIERDGRTFLVNHFDTIGRALARGSDEAVICFGHNHQFEIRRSGTALIVNPGEIFGGLTGSSTYALYDTATGQAVRVDVPDSP